MEERLSRVEEALQEVLKLLREGKQRVKYQAKYYAKRKETKMGDQNGLKNPDRNNLDLPMGWDKRAHQDARVGGGRLPVRGG